VPINGLFRQRERSAPRSPIFHPVSALVHKDRRIVLDIGKSRFRCYESENWMPSSLSTMVSEESERWSEFELPKLSLRELLALAKLLGCPSCGSKEAVIVRLLAQRELR
jgi:hypothetical protein